MSSWAMDWTTGNREITAARVEGSPGRLAALRVKSAPRGERLHSDVDQRMHGI